jgi:hypothetical protein
LVRLMNLVKLQSINAVVHLSSMNPSSREK